MCEARRAPKPGRRAHAGGTHVPEDAVPELSVVISASPSRLSPVPPRRGNVRSAVCLAAILTLVAGVQAGCAKRVTTPAAAPSGELDLKGAADQIAADLAKQI